MKYLFIKYPLFFDTRMFTTRNTCAAAPPPRRRRRCRVTPKFDSVDCRVTDFIDLLYKRKIVSSNSNPNPNNLNLNQHTAWDIQTLFSRHLQKRRDIPPQICWQRRRVTSQSDSSKMIHRLFCFIRKKVRWPPGSRKRNFSLKLIRKILTKIKHSMRNGKNRKSKLEC